MKNTIDIANIKPASVTKQTTDTGHHSFKGRGEFIRALMDQQGFTKIDAKDKPKLNEAIRTTVEATRARYPQNASPANVEKAFRAYLKRLAKAAAKEQEPAVATKEAVKPAVTKAARKGNVKAKGSKKTQKPAQTETAIAA